MIDNQVRQRIDYASTRLGRELAPIVRASRSIASGQEEMAQAQWATANALGGLLATAQSIDSELVNISSQLGDVTTLLTQIHETLRSPVKTQSAEYRDNGIWALSRQLVPEAIDQLLKAIDVYGQDPYARFYLGHAYLRAEQREAALGSYELASRYGVADVPGLAAGAALRGSAIAADLGQEGRGFDLLASTSDGLSNHGHWPCPSLQLAMACLLARANREQPTVQHLEEGGDAENIQRNLIMAMEYDAGLLVDALNADVGDLEAAAEAAAVETWRGWSEAQLDTIRRADAALSSAGRKLSTKAPTTLPLSHGSSRLVDEVMVWDQGRRHLQEQQKALPGAVSRRELGCLALVWVNLIVSVALGLLLKNAYAGLLLFGTLSLTAEVVNRVSKANAVRLNGELVDLQAEVDETLVSARPWPVEPM